MKRSFPVVLTVIALVVLLPHLTLAEKRPHIRADHNDMSTAGNDTLLLKQRDLLRIAGLEAFYSNQYDEAQSRFEKLTRLDPEHPSGYIYQAANIWMRQLFDTRRLHTSLYNNSQMESDIVSGPPPINERLDKEFRALLEMARTKAEAKLKTNKKDTEALYFLGCAYATQAGYEATMNRSFSALRAGSKAVEIHRKVLKLDPSFVDAYLTIGIYNYVVANMPLAARMLGTLFGHRGNESKGIAELERVAREGKYVADDARVVLATIYQREKRYDEALTMLRELERRYPKNYLLNLEKAALLVRSDRKKEAFDAFEQLLSNSHSVVDLVRFHYGDALLASGRFEEAAKQFLTAVELTNCDKRLMALAHFRAGQAFDLAKNRARALEQYEKVLACENAFNIHNRAREFIKRPFEK